MFKRDLGFERLMPKAYSKEYLLALYQKIMIIQKYLKHSSSCYTNLVISYNSSNH